MPVRRFTTVQEAEDAYADLEKENIELKAAAKNGVVGFLRGSVTEKVLLAVVAVFAASGVGVGIYNHNKIDKASDTQQQIKATTEQVAERTNEVGSGVDDVKRALKKKGPFE